MPVELKGSYLRIRVNEPRLFSKFGTQVFDNGKLKRIAGYSPKTGWKTQSWILNLKKYNRISAVNRINRLAIVTRKKIIAISKIRRYYRNKSS